MTAAAPASARPATDRSLGALWRSRQSRRCDNLSFKCLRAPGLRSRRPYWLRFPRREKYMTKSWSLFAAIGMVAAGIVVPFSQVLAQSASNGAVAESAGQTAPPYDPPNDAALVEMNKPTLRALV